MAGEWGPFLWQSSPLPIPQHASVFGCGGVCMDNDLLFMHAKACGAVVVYLLVRAVLAAAFLADTVCHAFACGRFSM